jgi:hypothetical protein
MTLFYPHQDRPRDSIGNSRSGIGSPWQMLATRLYELARLVVRRTSLAFRIVHRGIVAAKTRRFQRELTFHIGSRDDCFFQPHAHETHDPNKDAAKFPQRPLILGDKWDF